MTATFLSIKMLLSAVRQQWKLLLFFLFFLPILLSLGFWQLDRAEQKRQLLAVYQHQQNLPAKPIKDVSEKENSSYQNVLASGEYDNERYWLLDNRSRYGQTGYEVVMPLKVEQQWLLVNRGWVSAPIRRDQLPDIELLDKPVDIQGYLYQPSKNSVIKSNQSDWTETWPKRVLHLNYEQVAKDLGGEVYPVVMRIADESPGALITDWPVVNTLPEKHTGYAVQWFAMALALVLLYLWAIVKSVKKV